tara:strand:- start:43874 stop:44224 length:351 start_codon:yes stop_codon:yes gene_type:complete
LTLSELSEHFDTESLEMLREVMEEEFAELVQVYLKDSVARMPMLQNAIEQGQAQTVRELAHSFKGASSNISAAPLAKLCYELEIAGRENQLGNADRLYQSIQQEYQQVEALLRSMI